MPRRKSLVTVIRDMVREQVQEAETRVRGGCSRPRRGAAPLGQHQARLPEGTAAGKALPHRPTGCPASSVG
jgi:hypothetical protein